MFCSDLYSFTYHHFSAMQQAEILELIATHGQGNTRAIVENFKWDADSYPKLESAYKEAGKRHICRLNRQQVRLNMLHHMYTIIGIAEYLVLCTHKIIL